MSNIASMTLFDGASTPVSHIFTPESIKDVNGTEVATYREILANVPDHAQPRIFLNKKILRSGVREVSFRIEIPVMESVSGQNSSGYTAAPAIAYVNTMVVKGFFSPRATPTDSRIARQLAANMLNWVGISVAPTLVGTIPELFDNKVMPT